MQDEVKAMHAVCMYVLSLKGSNPSDFSPKLALQDKIRNGEPGFEASMYLLRQCAEYHFYPLILPDLFCTSCYNTFLLF